MDKSKKRRFFWIAAVIWGLAAFGIRFLILKNSILLDGRILASRAALVWTLAFSLVGLLLLFFLASCFRRKPGTDRAFIRAGILFLLPLVGAGLIFAGNVQPMLAFLKGESAASVGKLRLLASLLGLLAAPLMVAVLLRRRPLGRNAFWLQLPLILFTGVNMIRHFRNWSHDPIILDIAPLALSAICFLLGTVLIAGFSVLVGRRRSTAVWCSMAVIFTVMSLPDFLLGAKTDVSTLMVWLGLALWCGFHAGMLVAEPPPLPKILPMPERPTAGPAPEPDAAPEPEAPAAEPDAEPAPEPDAVPEAEAEAVPPEPEPDAEEKTAEA